MICANCGKPMRIPNYTVSGAVSLSVCSKICLVASVVPEVSGAIVLAQWVKPEQPRWVPNEEEEERMRQ